jgi:hypothetical protein
MDVSEVLKLADKLMFGVNSKYLDSLEKSIVRGVYENRKYADIADEYGCTEGHVNDVAADLWQVFSSALGEKVKKINFRSTIERHQFSKESATAFIQQISLLNVCSDITVNNHQNKDSTANDLDRTPQYLKDIPDILPFYGRTEELDLLKTWILEEQCRSIVISGTIGIGKTSLARQLLEQIKSEFDEIVWQSVGCKRSLVEFIDRNLLLSLSISSLPEPPLDLEARISLLIEYLRQHRCLIILDDLDRLFTSGELSGNYATKYHEYQELFRRLRETNHQSCLLLLSREEPSKLSGVNHSLQLGGLGEAGKEIFREKGLTDKDKWDEAIEYIGGNPSYLTAILIAVNQLFGGRIGEFCKCPELFLTEEVRSSLTWQFDRLSEPEKEVVKAVAIEPKPVNMCQLIELLKISPADISNAILSLGRRRLIDRLATDNAILFSLQPIVRQFILLGS